MIHRMSFLRQGRHSVVQALSPCAGLISLSCHTASVSAVLWFPKQATLLQTSVLNFWNVLSSAVHLVNSKASLKKRFCLFIFREKGREGERQGEKYQCVVASHVSPTGDPACNLGMCPDWESYWQPFGSQAGT